MENNHERNAGINGNNKTKEMGKSYKKMIIMVILSFIAMYILMYSIIILSTAVLAGIFFYFGIRQQAFVGDKQFLKSMIPHHAAAILMVKEASLSDLEVKQLGEEIIAS